ncbi:MAG: diguanylate cyclase [Actinomycetes bacterium]
MEPSDDGAYRVVAENSTDVAWLLSDSLLIRWVSPSSDSIMGWRPDQLVGTDPQELIHPEDQQLLDYRRALSPPGSTAPCYEVRKRMANSCYRWVSVQVRATTDVDGSFNGAVVGLRDVHDDVLAREATADSELLFRRALEGAPQGIAIVGLHFGFVQVNQALRTLIDREPPWFAAHSVRDVIHAEDLEPDMTDRDDLLKGQTCQKVREQRWLRADSSVVWVLHSISLLRDGDGMPLFYVSHVKDISRERAAKAELNDLAHRDPLTGTLNRHQLGDRLNELLTRQAGARRVAAILYCDLDRFKTINDTYGHAAGDHTLRIIAQRITATVRSNDIVNRTGGDEFIILLNDLPNAASAAAIAEDIRAAAEESVEFADMRITSTISIGVAIGCPGKTADEILGNADLALYKAKGSGRNRVVVSECDPTTSVRIGRGKSRLHDDPQDS